MLYLFNSSSRETYFDNVFSTLYLPYGCDNLFQYSYLKNNAVENTALEAYSDEEVLIIYIDKFSEKDIAYIPLRKGKLIKSERNDGRIYYSVLMLDYVHARNIKAFSAHIYDYFEGKIYSKKSMDKWAGVLAIREKHNSFEEKGLIMTSDRSWLSTVETLSDRTLFKSNNSLFLRLEIIDDRDKVIKPQSDKNPCGFVLDTSKKYTLKVSTYIRDYFNNNPMSKIVLTITDSASLCGLQSKTLEVGSMQTQLRTPISVTKDNDKTLLTISYAKKEQSDPDIKCNNKGCYIYASEGIKAYTNIALIVLCVVVLALATWVNTLPVNSIISDFTNEMNAGTIIWYRRALYELCVFLDNTKYYSSAISSALITLATLGLIRFYGKPNLKN